MLQRSLSWVALLIGVAALLTLLAWFFAPQVIAVDPPDGQAIPANASLALTFSQPMQPESIAARLTIQPDIPGSFHWDGARLIFTPQQSWGYGSRITVSLAGGGQTAGFPWLPMWESSQWTIDVRAPQLLVLSPADGPADLYRLDPANLAAEPQRLTTIQGGILEYALDSRGLLAAFSTRAGPLYLLDLVSGETRQLDACLQATCRYPQPSPDGRWVAFQRTDQSNPNANPQVVILPLDGGELQYPDTQAISAELPLWSPTGWLVYYEATPQRYTAWNPLDDRHVLWSNQTGEPGAWSPDGQTFVAPEIFFIPNAITGSTGELEPLPTSQLLAYSLGGAAADTLVTMDDQEDTSPAISPDGETLAFARKYLDPQRWTLGRQLWVLDLDSGQTRALTQSPYENYANLAWSPDGDWIAFVVSDQAQLDRLPETGIVRPDGSRYTILLTGAYAPQWTP